MATTVVDLGVSNAKTEFSGSSAEDVSYAKTFWQSIQLHPPIESRLVSSDIRQRLKVAPPAKQSVNISHYPIMESEKLVECLKKAHTEQHLAQLEHYQMLSEKRHQDLDLLHKHRAHREQKEQLSAAYKGVTKREQEPTMSQPISDGHTSDESPEHVLQELDKFDAEHGNLSD